MRIRTFDGKDPLWDSDIGHTDLLLIDEDSDIDGKDPLLGFRH
jgi:hypothetical protein